MTKLNPALAAGFFVARAKGNMAAPPAFRCVFATGLGIMRCSGQQTLKTGANRVTCWRFSRPSRRQNMFRRTLLASVGAIAVTGAALAADLPSRAPPPVFLPPPPIFTWTGLYAGLNAGYTWSNSNTVNTATADLFGNPDLPGGPAFGVASAALATRSVPAKIDGFIGGGQIGYIWQLTNSWVFGLEADIQGVAANNGGTLVFSQATVAGFPANPIDQNLSSRRRLDYLGTVRGRVGFTITPTFLVYGTGGLAYGQTRASTSITQIVESDPILPNHYSSLGSFS